MDEVGRGTTVADGLSIAFATVHHLHTKNQCRALFATHFHELADMLGLDEATGKASGVFENVSFFCTDVDEIPVSSDPPYRFKSTLMYWICREVDSRTLIGYGEG